MSGTFVFSLWSEFTIIPEVVKIGDAAPRIFLLAGKNVDALVSQIFVKESFGDEKALDQFYDQYG